MSEQIVQEPAFERPKRETNGHTTVANGHMSPARAPALSRSLGLRRQPARRSRRVRVDLVVDRV